MKLNDLSPNSKSGAGCLIMARDTKRVLLIQRSELVPVPLTWVLPGGGVDQNETPLESAKREVIEEVGFDIDDRPMLLIYTNETHAPRFKFYTFACVVEKEFEPKLNWESRDSIWCDIGDLPENLHWGVSQLFNSDRAAKKLKNFMDSNLT